jgi:hypothetical protein
MRFKFNSKQRLQIAHSLDDLPQSAWFSSKQKSGAEKTFSTQMFCRSKLPARFAKFFHPIFFKFQPGANRYMYC